MLCRDLHRDGSRTQLQNMNLFQGVLREHGLDLPPAMLRSSTRRLRSICKIVSVRKCYKGSIVCNDLKAKREFRV